MRNSLLILVLAASGACGGSRYVQRVPAPPPSVVQAPTPAPVVSQPAREPLVPGQSSGTNEEATRAYLQKELERKKAQPPVRTPEPEVVYQESPVANGYDYPYGTSPYYGSPPADTISTFPWYTAAGATLGASIGHHSDHTSEGAWIGAGIGLLFDLPRWIY